MSKRKSRLELAQEKTQAAINETNAKIEELGESTAGLYDRLNEIQDLFDVIRNVPSKEKLEFEELKKIRLSWKDEARKIERDNKAAVAKNAGAGAAGVGAGVALAAFGPTAAMGIATTFGVASTGTAISSLTGAAATNAALAWLGGGALAAGGGGMVAGKALLILAGPVGWAIAGVSLLSSGLLLIKSIKEKKKLENIFTLISDRDVRSYQLAVIELDERIKRIGSEASILSDVIDEIRTFGTDYSCMSESQQYELGTAVNLMASSTQLLTNPILGLQPKFSENDFYSFASWEDKNADEIKCIENQKVIIALANLLFGIDVEEGDRKLLWRSFRRNKKFLSSLDVKKRNFDYPVMEAVYEALDHGSAALN